MLALCFSLCSLLFAKFDRIFVVLTLVCTIVCWSLVTSTQNTIQGEFSWAYIISIISSVFAFLSLILTLGENREVNYWGELQFLTKMPVLLFLATLSFACAFGSMPTMVTISTQTLQSQFGSFFALTFLVFQFISIILLFYGKIVSTLRVILNVVSTCIIWAAFTLLTNSNVLPVILTSYTQFYVQGFLLGAAITQTLFNVICFIKYYYYGREQGREKVPFVWIYIIIVSSLILGCSFSSLYVYVEASSSGNVASPSEIATMGCFTLAVIFSVSSHSLTCFLIHSGKSIKQPRILIWTQYKLLFCFFFFGLSGFGVNVAFERSIVYSSGAMLSALILSLLLMGIQLLTFKEIRVRTTWITKGMSNNTRKAGEEDQVLERAKQELLKETLALKLVQERMLQQQKQLQNV